jgi:hypothetical protein
VTDKLREGEHLHPTLLHSTAMVCVGRLKLRPEFIVHSHFVTAVRSEAL